ncbi:TauD/TfdA family dioxygenase [Lentzea albida]|uniref:Taurine dioxygenase, alpha-ketoglutarate-dependent n=1 Tax=Lentzea albida TaxID=65499 RepID=A0A1H9C2F0_9PSEU|nr:TauD/TfdA family dioxygenase [Lentzea albida]SEP95127.1 Taurine dioxygenase, alpha-ketoglutarate-dependent [Lentzea albida]
MQRTSALPHLVEAPDGRPLDERITDEWPNVLGHLDRAGAVLFRGFDVPDVESFRRVVTAAMPDLLDYEEPSTPRTEISGRVFTSTEYPADQRIPLHNEMAYRRTWPQYLWFWCGTASDSGGETTLADYRRVLDRLSSAVRKAFETRHVLYERVYNTGVDLTWQHVFRTDDRADLEERLRAQEVEFEWLDDERLRTREVVEGVVTHPRTGMVSWFNQANLFHPSSLPAEVRAALEDALGVDGMPRTARFGDGGDIPEEMLDEVRAAIDAETVRRPWEAGDVLVVDNHSVAHGREPFTGARRVCVAMSGITRSRLAGQ